MSRVLSFALCGALSFASLSAQYVRRPNSGANPLASTGAYNEPAATMHGVLHQIDSKKIVLMTDEDQLVNIIRTHKTKFLRGGKEIKPTEVALGSIISVDVGKFPDLSPQAVNVMVDSPPIPGVTPVAAKTHSIGDDMDEERPADESKDTTPTETSARPLPVAGQSAGEPQPLFVTPAAKAANPSTASTSAPTDSNAAPAAVTKQNTDWLDQERPAQESVDPSPKTAPSSKPKPQPAKPATPPSQ